MDDYLSSQTLPRFLFSHDRVFQPGEKHVTRICSEDVLLLVFSGVLRFVEDGTPAGGQSARTISVKFSNYKTGVFTYDPDSGQYLVEEYDQPYVDGNTGEQVAVTNVLVLFTDVSRISGDTAGRLDVRMTGSGTGYFACGGKYIPITWSKQSHSAPLVYTTADGQSLALGVGPSYINIVDESYPVTIQ